LPQTFLNVALRERKELGVDQHTPIDVAGKLNGGNGGVARAPEQATRDGLSASFAAAKSITAEKLGDTARTFIRCTPIKYHFFYQSPASLVL
jgi:hypothetical protein